MAFQETELHKIHLRLEALEAEQVHPALQPDPTVAHLSTVKVPEVVEPKSKKGK